MTQRKMSKREALEWAKSLPDDDDETTVHVVKVRKNDPGWAWLFGSNKSENSPDESDDDPEDDPEGEPKPEPKPKSRNRFFGDS